MQGPPLTMSGCLSAGWPGAAPWPRPPSASGWHAGLSPAALSHQLNQLGRRWCGVASKAAAAVTTEHAPGCPCLPAAIAPDATCAWNPLCPPHPTPPQDPPGQRVRALPPARPLPAQPALPAPPAQL
jgi:hypothetical protein